MGISSLKNRFVGRENELKDLKGLLDLAIRGQGQLLLIKGDPGIGKTRLVEELREYADLNGVLFLKGQCTENSFQPYGSLRKALIDLVEKVKHNPRWLEKIKASAADKSLYLIRLIPNIEDILGNISDQRGEQYTKKRAPYSRIITDFFIKIATHESPLILFLDDLQWVDEESTRFLEHFISRIASSHILAIGAYRPQELEIKKDHPLFFILDKKMTSFTMIEISLSPLLRINVKEMVEDLLKIREDEIDILTSYIYHKTKGNPFFTKEFINFLKDRNIIYLNEEGEWKFQEERLYNVPYPIDMLNTIKSRIAQLKGVYRHILCIASAIGTEFEVDLLTEVTGKKKAIKDVCQKGVDIGAIFKVGKNKYCFTHDLIKDSLYNSLNPKVKKQIHLNIGEYLEKAQPRNIFLLSYHFGQAKQKEKSLKYLLMEAREAEKLFCHSRAKEYYLKALENVSKSRFSTNKGEMIIDLTINIAKLDWIASDIPCLDLLKDAERLAIDLKKDKKLALIYLWMGRIYYVRGEPKESAKYHQRCLEMAKKVEYHILKNLYTIDIGRVNFCQGKHKEAIDYFSHGIKVLSDKEDDDDLSYCHTHMAMSYSFLGKYEEAKNHYEEAIRLAEKTQNPNTESAGYFSQAIYNFKKFSWENGIESCLKAITPYPQQEVPIIRYLSTIWLGIGYLIGGAVDTARNYLIESIQISKNHNTRLHLSLAYSYLGETYLRRDNMNEAKYWVERALVVAQGIDNKYEEAIALFTLSRIQSNNREYNEAENNLKKSIAILKDAETLPDLALCYLHFGHIYQKKNDIEMMNWWCDRAKEIFIKLGLMEYFKRLDIKSPERFILKIDKRQKIVFYKGLEINLTSLGYNLFLFLAINPGKWITYEQLYEEIWGNIHVELYQIVDHKRKIMKAFKMLIGKDGITEDEINNLIINRRNVGYFLNLQDSHISISE